MRKALLLATLATLVLGSAICVAAPKKSDQAGGPTAKAPAACGAKILPLAEGNQWTYSQAVSPLPPDDQIKRLSPLEPKTIVITVKSIDNRKGPDTVITLEEKITTDLTKDEKKPVFDEHTITTTITCNAKSKFEISPDSFFFAGEPGGYYGLTLDKIDRSKDTSLKLTNGTIGEQTWREDIVAHWTRNPSPGSDAKLGSGKLELERSFTPQQPEQIITKLGTYKAEKLGLITTGRVTLDGAAPEDKPMELPAGWVNQLWLADNVGVVQVQNHFAHMYQLTAATLK